MLSGYGQFLSSPQGFQRDPELLCCGQTYLTLGDRFCDSAIDGLRQRLKIADGGVVNLTIAQHTTFKPSEALREFLRSAALKQLGRRYTKLCRGLLNGVD